MAYVKNTWVDREGVTRYFETIDSDGAKIFTPDYTQITELGTPVNADNMNHIEEGIENHENRITILEEGGDASNFLNKSQITNCLLEVPQNIKLELADGALTLKAGSKVIVPNGFYDNGEIRFDEITITSDVTYTATVADHYTRLVYYSKITGKVQAFVTHTSGVTAPTTGTNAMFYNTTDNTVRRYNDGVISVDEYSLPLGIITANGEVTTGAIDQVFNGFGYIGSTVFALPNVKGLIPNGRNEDGTLKNREFTTDKVNIKTIENTVNGSVVCVITEVGAISRGYTPNFSHDTLSNRNIWFGNNSLSVDFVEFTAKNGVISNFKPKLPFRAIDTNELEEVHCVTETYINGTSWYRVWSDGWCEQGGYTSANSVTFLKPFKDTNYSVASTFYQATADLTKTGHFFAVTKTTTGMTRSYTSTTVIWEARGYIS